MSWLLCSTQPSITSVNSRAPESSRRKSRGNAGMPQKKLFSNTSRKPGPSRVAAHTNDVNADIYLKHERFVLICQDAVFGVQAYRFGQHAAFHVAAFAHQVGERVAVVAVDNILGNDRPLVQLLGDVVSRRANDLDAALKCLLVWVRSAKRWQEAVMDIDDPAWVSVHKEWLQYLHI